jgi:poly-gamma-glutamate capsule biosynthesis protein CapA/YwtB (metallophosphatase superfamily)
MRDLCRAGFFGQAVIALIMYAAAGSAYARQRTGAGSATESAHTRESRSQTQTQGGLPDGFMFAAGGDLIGPYIGFQVDSEPGMAGVARLFRMADLGFANQEGAMFDNTALHLYQAAENGGGTPVYSPDAAKDLRAIGITIVSKANNHATDWGTAGLEATFATLKAAGIVQAGSGLSASAARAPGYVETRLGRAALVDVASTFPPMSVAGDAVTYRGEQTLARPGISALRVRLVRLVSAEELASLRRIAGAAAYPTKGRVDQVRVGDVLFRASAAPGLTWEMEPSDEAAVLGSVREARRNARFVLFSIHAHETAGDADDGPADFQPIGLHFANEAASSTDVRPADFEPMLFHAVIDAGADAVVRTGPHVLGGIEIYKGKPIFYSLGSLFFPFGNRRSFVTAAGETLTFPEECFESVVPVTVYRDGVMSEVRLYPVAIEKSAGPTLGFPHLAGPEQALRILGKLQALSAAYGTTISIEDEVGVIRNIAN